MPGRPLLPLLLPGLPTGGAGVTLWLAGAGAALPADGVGGAVGGGREEVLGLAGEGACCACVCRGGGGPRARQCGCWRWFGFPHSQMLVQCAASPSSHSHTQHPSIAHAHTPAPQHSTCSHPSTAQAITAHVKACLLALSIPTTLIIISGWQPMGSRGAWHGMRPQPCHYCSCWRIEHHSTHLGGRGRGWVLARPILP